MKTVFAELLGSACTHSLAQLNAVIDAARRIEHPLARLVEMAILAPGITDVLSAVDVRDVDLRAGTVVLPFEARQTHVVALGSVAMDIIEEMICGRKAGPLITDPHGDPLLPDDDSSDYAVELLGGVSRDARSFAWDLRSLRTAAITQLTGYGVPSRSIAWASGIEPLPLPNAARRRVLLEQVMVHDFIAHLLERQAADLPGDFWPMGAYDAFFCFARCAEIMEKGS